MRIIRNIWTNQPKVKSLPDRGNFDPKPGLALTPATVSVEEPAVFRDFAMSSHITMAAVEGSGRSPAAAARPTQIAAKTTTKITKT
jgi:hypothetical protein